MTTLLFFKRCAAFIVDGIVATVVYIAAVSLLFGADYFDTGGGTYQVSVPLVLYAAYWLGLWFWRGTTPGMLLFGLRVIDADNGSAPLRWQWWVRALGMLVAAAPAGLGFLWALWDPEGRAWQDHISGTRVVGQPA